MKLSAVTVQRRPGYPDDRQVEHARSSPGTLEYGIIVGLISTVAIAALTATGGQVRHFGGQVGSIYVENRHRKEPTLPPKFVPWEQQKKESEPRTEDTWMGPSRPIEEKRHVEDLD